MELTLFPHVDPPHGPENDHKRNVYSFYNVMQLFCVFIYPIPTVGAMLLPTLVSYIAVTSQC